MVVSIFYLIASYAQVAGFGFDLDNIIAERLAAPLFALGSPEAPAGTGRRSSSTLLVVVVFLDILAVGVGAATASTRGVFAMARDRRLPGGLASVSKQYGTPIGAIVLLIVVRPCSSSLNEFWTTSSLSPELPHYFAIFVWASTFGGFALLVVYLLMSIGAFRGLVRPAAAWLGCAIAVDRRHRAHRRRRSSAPSTSVTEPDHPGAMVRPRSGS